MKVKNVIEQVEHVAGRQSENYTIQMINDALFLLLIEVAVQHIENLLVN